MTSLAVKNSGPEQMRDVEYTQRDFQRITEILKAMSGIRMPDSNEALVYSRLAKRVRSLGLSKFTDYIALIEHTGNKDEQEFFITALTTNTTRFFREEYHFETFATELLPGLADAAMRGERVRLWSAACSSGEEPYTLAAVVMKHRPEVRTKDFKILATDINREVLSNAARGVYPASVLDKLEDGYEDVMFDRDGSGSVSVRQPLKDLITFRYMNFMDPWPVRGPFAAIFCRNVMIYMDDVTQARVWAGLSSVLKPGGYLFIGHSERIGPDFKDVLQLVGKTTFRRL